MAIKLIVAVTDRAWFDQLSAKSDLAEVNFWAPGGAPFKALSPGELFLFKLHAPDNFIVGGGIFAHSNILPCSLAWEAFGEKNGARSLPEMRARIARYRHVDPADRTDFEIGCRVLTQPFFLPRSAWISVPASWSRNIVAYKGYSTDEPDGRRLWEAVQSFLERAVGGEAAPGIAEAPARYGDPVLIRPRLGQGAFRLLVTDVYERRCAVTRERTLPALEAAHIRPYGEGGVHEASNGLLLRRDIHSLFDAGYVTVAPDLRFEVSRRIKEDYENGRDYYALHGRPVSGPTTPQHRPDRSALIWHNEQRFRG
jgi:putative restriction endonuclease